MLEYTCRQAGTRAGGDHSDEQQSMGAAVFQAVRPLALIRGVRGGRTLGSFSLAANSAGALPLNSPMDMLKRQSRTT